MADTTDSHLLSKVDSDFVTTSESKSPEKEASALSVPKIKRPGPGSIARMRACLRKANGSARRRIMRQIQRRHGNDILAKVMGSGSIPKKNATRLGGPILKKDDPGETTLAVPKPKWTGDICTLNDLKIMCFPPYDTKRARRERPGLVGKKPVSSKKFKKGNLVAVVPYESFDSDKPPVVIIHGFGPVFPIIGLAEKLRTNGRQVFIVFYHSVELAASGSALAAELTWIGQKYYKGRQLDIVGHSQGGVVALCAVNDMYSPAGSDGTATADPGFSNVRVIGADTGIEGASSRTETWLVQLIKIYFQIGPTVKSFFIWSKDKRKSFIKEHIGDMGANSLMFDGLFNTMEQLIDKKLLIFQNIAAKNPQGTEDFHLSVLELRTSEAFLIGKAIYNDQPPYSFPSDGKIPPARKSEMNNLFLGLKRDFRYGKLRTALQIQVDSDETILEDAIKMQAALNKAFEETMPPVEGKHMGLLSNSRKNKKRTDDMIDRVLEQLNDPDWYK